VERAGAQVGADGDRIGLERGAGQQVRLGVGAHRRADVPALDVEDAQHAGGAGRGEQLLEHCDALRAVALEEGGLRLDRADLPRDRLEGAQRELTHPLRGVGQRPGLEEGSVRVDARHDPPPLLDGLAQPRPEGRGLRGGPRHAVPGHAELPTGLASAVRAAVRAAVRRSVWSWRLITSKGSTGRASIAWTAAWNSCSVVIIGTSMLVAAARIA